MKYVLVLVVTAAAGFCFTTPALAAVAPNFAFSPAKAPHPLPLDATLSDPTWQAGKVPTDGPWQNVTTRSSAPHVTTAYLLYDDRNLYVGFVADQKGTPIVATQPTNDVGFGTDDFVGIGLDTSGAGSQAYVFETTPKGIRYEQASENVRYRPVWQSAAAVDGETWRAVMIIPLDILRLHPGAGQTWRINFFRNLASVGDHYVWAYNGAVQDQPAGQWPGFVDLRFWAAASDLTVHTSGASRPKPRLEVYGLGSTGVDRNQFQQSNGTFQYERARAVGADFSYPLTPTINLVGTANPDFSNVEIDQQTIAPQEFRRQLNEYRPFFAQGANYTNPVPDNSNFTNNLGPQNHIFYSPSVGPFDTGAKVEGTFGNQSFGVMNFRGFDELSGNTFSDVVYGYKHALQDEKIQYWTDGVLAHHSLAGNDETIEAGAKGRNLNNKLVWSADTAVERGSWVPQGSAHSSFGYIGVHRENYVTLIGYNDMSPNYNPIDGFTSTSDIRGLQSFLQLTGTSHKVKNYQIFMTADRLFDRSGAIHEADAGLFLNATFNNKFSLNGAGPTISSLREYDVPSGPNCSGPSIGKSFYTGFPCYRNGVSVPFNVMAVPIGYGDGTPAPIDVSANWGNFGNAYLHLYTATTSRPIGSHMTLGLEYDGTYERDRTTSVLESQWLRRVSLGFDTGHDSNLTISLRGINGIGGFAPLQGTNLAAAFHMRFTHGDLYLNYGTPAAGATLNRFVVKYVIRAGGDAGT